MIRVSTPFKFITILFVSAFCFIVQQAVSNGSGPPAGMTNAPGESDCTSCHTGTAVTNSSAISVFTNMTNGQYIPDSTYQIIIRGRSTGCVKFGFETTMLNTNSTPSAIGALSVPTAASNVQYTNSGSRDYIMHTSSGTSAIYTDSTEWVINWQAPSSIQGSAKLYVALNVTDNSGTNSGDEINLKEFTFAPTTNVPVASITTNVNTICQSDSIYFQASGTNNPTSYQWIFPGGTPSTSTSQNQWVKFSSGNKVCSLRVANSIMYSSYVTKSVTVNALPSGTISSSSSNACEGDSISLSISFTSGYTYQWQKDQSNISGATSSGYYAKTSGSYRVIITNTSGGCSFTTAPVALTFNVKPTAALTAPSGTSGCQGDSVRLKANSGANYSYFWYKDNVLQLQTLDSNYYAKQTGSYYVKIVNNNTSCNNQSGVIGVNFFIKPSGSISSVIDSICQGDSVLLGAVTSDTIVTFQWKRNGSNINNATSKNYYANLSGTYTVDMTSNRGCKSTTTSKTIKVNPLPAANFIDSVKNICTYSLRIRNTGNFSFKWQLNGSVINTTDTIITATSGGFYNVIITNSSGCSISTNTLFIPTINAPNATITPLSNAVICSDSSGVTYQVPSATGASYKWYKNGSIINGASLNFLNLTDSGNYYVVVDNGSCAVQSSVRNVKVNAVPTANFIDSTRVGCTYSLKLRKTGNFNIQWMRGGVVFNTTDTMITVTQSGTYSMKITNASGCSVFTNSLSLTLPTGIPDATITPSGNAVLCSDSSGVTYQVPLAAGASYVWYKNGNLIANASSNSLNITDSGNYYVAVSNGFCSVNSSVRNVKLNPTPVAVVSTGDSTFCTGDSVILGTAVIAGANYQWSKNGTPISAATNSTYIARTPGSYNVRTTLNGCSKTSNNIQVVEKTLPAVPIITRNVNTLTSSAASSYQWFKNGVAINGATLQTYTISADGSYAVKVAGVNGCMNKSTELPVTFTGIRVNGTTAIMEAYPNPVYYSLNLVFAVSGTHSIELSDAAGRLLLHFNSDENKTLVDFSGFEAGIYFIKVSSGDYSQVLRIVKK